MTRPPTATKKKPGRKTGRKPRPAPVEAVPMIPDPTRDQMSTILNDHTRLIGINLMLKSGKVSPLEVMFENMWWAHEEAESLADRLHEQMLIAGASGSQEDAEAAFDLYRELFRIKGVSQACARDAAPYVHAKLNGLDIETLSRNDRQITHIRRTIVDPKDTGK